MEIMQGVVDAVNRFHALGKVERDLAGEEIEKLQGELRRNEGTLEIAYRELDKKNKLLAERHAQLTEQHAQLAEQEEQLAEQGEQLTEQEEQLAEQDEQLAEQDEQLAEKDAVSRECMAQCNEWKEKALSALREKDTLLADIESLRSKLGESQKLTENMPAKPREYKAKLNEAIDEQQDLYHRSLAYCDSATDTIQQEKNARASSASEVVMALEANRNKQAELREGYRTVCEELQRDSERSMCSCFPFSLTAAYHSIRRRTYSAARGGSDEPTS
jgi:chromosome segregation ATPase